MWKNRSLRAVGPAAPYKIPVIARPEGPWQSPILPHGGDGTKASPRGSEANWINSRRG